MIKYDKNYDVTRDLVRIARENKEQKAILARNNKIIAFKANQGVKNA